MRVLLGLRKTKLCVSLVCKPLAEGIGDLDFLERYFLVRDGLVIILEADILHIEALSARASLQFVKLVEIIITEAVRDLTCSVGTEIEENDRVSILDGGYRCSVLFEDNRRADELIRFVLVIGLRDRLVRRVSSDALALRERIIRIGDTVVVIVPVHCVITSGDHRDLSDAEFLHLILELLNVIDTALRGCITSVEEAVYIDIRKSLFLCHLEQRIKVCDMAVDTAVREKAVQMQVSSGLLYILHCVKELRILEELAVLDFLGDAGKILINDAAGAHIHVTDLRVAHLAVRKTDRKTARVSFDEGIFLHQLVHDGRFCLGDRIVKRVVGKAIAVKNE